MGSPKASFRYTSTNPATRSRDLSLKLMRSATFVVTLPLSQSLMSRLRRGQDSLQPTSAAMVGCSCTAVQNAASGSLLDPMYGALNSVNAIPSQPNQKHRAMESYSTGPNVQIQSLHLADGEPIGR